MVILESEYLDTSDVAELEDKTFTVCKGCYFKKLQQLDGTEKDKLIVPVKLSSEKIKPWIPNKTSENKLKKMYGKETDKWIGQKAEFILAKQNVRGEIKDVIFVK